MIHTNWRGGDVTLQVSVALIKREMLTIWKNWRLPPCRMDTAV